VFVALFVDIIFVAVCMSCMAFKPKLTATQKGDLFVAGVLWTASAFTFVGLLIYTWTKDIKCGLLLCIWVGKS
jgi:hypothetical protein